MSSITATAGTRSRRRDSFRAFLQAFRLKFVPPSFMPVILCTAIAWSRDRVFDPAAFLLVIFGVTVNHFGLNMLDDIVDYGNFVDCSGGPERNPYAGGSGVLTEGLLTVRQLLVAVVICFIMTALIGIYLAFLKGWPVLAFGFFGLFCSIFYTVPPIRFGYRGYGELGLLINFGPVIGLGSYYVQTQTLDFEPMLVPLIPGFLMWSMIIINEIPDYEDDRRGGKWNLVARFGRETGIVLYIAGLVFAYGILTALVISEMAPSFILLGLLSLPVAVYSVGVLRKHYADRMKLVPANLAIIRIYMLTGFGLIAGYILDGVL
jgi:1,4-dihydroxy-2-naphthoate polyprenyltransferase